MRVTPLRLILGWLLVALFFSAQNILVHVSRGMPMDWQWDVFHEFVYWGLWAALTPTIFRASSAATWGRRLLPAAPVALVQIAATYSLHGLILLALGVLPAADARTWFVTKVPGLIWGTFTGALYYALIAAMHWTAEYRRMYHAERLAAAKLHASLTGARLDALRGQLQPHFLFNTLNAIAVLTEESPERARQMVIGLGELLRVSLDQGERHEVPLARELEILERYLAIQRERFGSRLRTQIAIPDECLPGLVPVLLLQPLVENAIRHGVEGRMDGGQVTITATRDGATLTLEVRDEGGGTAPGTAGNGVGLANSRARLEELYGTAATLSLDQGPGGTVARVSLPYRAA